MASGTHPISLYGVVLRVFGTGAKVGMARPGPRKHIPYRHGKPRIVAWEVSGVAWVCICICSYYCHVMVASSYNRQKNTDRLGLAYNSLLFLFPGDVCNKRRTYQEDMHVPRRKTSTSVSAIKRPVIHISPTSDRLSRGRTVAMPCNCRSSLLIAPCASDCLRRCYGGTEGFGTQLRFSVHLVAPKKISVPESRWKHISGARRH